MRVAISLFWLSLLALVSAKADDAILTLSASTDREIYLPDSRNEVLVNARIRAAAAAEPASPAIRNIVWVLDASGSMAGERMQALRQAVAGAVDGLAEQDLVAVVVFGSEVETLVEATRKGVLGNITERLAAIEPSGGSALYDALNQGAAQLRRNAGPGTIDQLLLISDGPATKGPREFDDFSRLVEVFARENIGVSTIGVGPDFDEDLFAAMARSGQGGFHYVAELGPLADVLKGEIAVAQPLVARDVMLVLEFVRGCEEVESIGWREGMVDRQTVTYRFSQMQAGQELGVLASTVIFRPLFGRELVNVTLRWTDPKGGEVHEVQQALMVDFDSDRDWVAESVRPEVMRTVAGVLVAEGFQDAIEFLDKGDLRRALRALQRARNEVQTMNDNLEDTGIAGLTDRLNKRLGELQARGLNAGDRKLFRSGWHNEFEVPMADGSLKEP